MSRGMFDKSTSRQRGRKGVAQRQRRLFAEPLCRHCNERGFVTKAVEVDHILPLAFGGTDTDDNVQCLCRSCHEAKTAFEDVSHNAALTHPHWLIPSAIPVEIVCGPPCSGKTTYVRANASPSDVVVDIDTIAITIDEAYTHWTGMLSGELLDRSMRVRNALLGSLSKAQHGKAWFIVSAPTVEERTWWAERLGGVVTLLHPGVEECKRRAVDRGTPQASRGVDEWERKSRQRWAPKAPRPTFGVDGYPA